MLKGSAKKFESFENLSYPKVNTIIGHFRDWGKKFKISMSSS